METRRLAYFIGSDQILASRAPVVKQRKVQTGQVGGHERKAPF